MTSMALCAPGFVLLCSSHLGFYTISCKHVPALLPISLIFSIIPIDYRKESLSNKQLIPYEVTLSGSYRTSPVFLPLSRCAARSFHSPTYLRFHQCAYRRRTLNSILSVDSSLTSIVLKRMCASSIMASSSDMSSLYSFFSMSRANYSSVLCNSTTALFEPMACAFQPP